MLTTGTKLKINAGMALMVLMGGFVFSVPAFAQNSKNKTEITPLSLSVGVYHDEKIPLAPDNFSKVGNNLKILRLQYNPKTNMLRIYPKQKGDTTLAIKDNKTGEIIYNYSINVTKSNLFTVAREIRSLLSDIEGIQIKIINNRVIVDGQILLPRDMIRIHSVVKQYGGLASSLVTLSPVAQTKIAQFIERAINNPEIQVRAVNGKFILEGMANSKPDKDRAEIIAKTYVPDVIVDEAVADKKVLERKADVVINLINIKPAPEAEPSKTIQMVVHFVELSKNYEKGFRFQWTPDLGDGSSLEFSTGGRSPGGAIATITGTVRNLLPKLNWAKEHGHARVLQSTSIIVQDGKQGVLNSISRIPYQTRDAQGTASTSFEETGIRAEITPNVLGARSDSVNLDMNFAVKALVDTTAAGPLTSSREIKTVLVVRSGQSAAVGGLISNDTGTAYNRLPKDVSPNPLFSLYASKNFRRSQSQFVIFVTPIIKSSASAGSEKIKRKFRLTD